MIFQPLSSVFERLDPRRAQIAALLLALLYAGLLVGLRWLPINDALVFGLMLTAVVTLLDRCSPARRGVTLHAITQVIVLSWVLSLWTIGYEGRSAVFGGILPWSDSFDYTNDALRLMHGHALQFTAKRPLYPVSLSGLLALTDGNLRVALLAFAVFGAWAVALAVNAVWNSHGRWAALIVFALLLLSERHWAGFVQTEGLGLPLGLIGFTLLWRAASNGERRLVYAGLFALTMALMARAGAFFILPAIALWGALFLAPKPERLRTGLFALLAIIAGVAVHEVVLHIAGAGVSFSDYPAIVFGLIHHHDYTYLLEQHPELATLTGTAKTAAAWHLVLADSAAHPGLLLLGLLRSLVELFYTPNGLFSFVWRNPDDVIFENGPALRAALAQYGFVGPVVYWVQQRGLYSLFNGITMALAAIAFVVSVIAGLIALYRHPADRYGMLLRFAIGGVLLSAPFTPPWITGAHQVEVATLAFMALVPALWRVPVSTSFAASSKGLVRLPPVFAAAVMLTAFVLVRWPAQTPTCGEGCTPMQVYQTTMVRVMAERTFTTDGRAADDLLASLQFLKKHNPELVSSLEPYVARGSYFVLAYDAKTAASRILIDNRWQLGTSPWQDIDAVPLDTPVVQHILTAKPLP